MIEAFGLDTRVENYKGIRPISFYSWDLDCILDVLDMVLNDEKEYPDNEDEGYIQLQELYTHLKNEYKKHTVYEKSGNKANPSVELNSEPWDREGPWEIG